MRLTRQHLLRRAIFGASSIALAALAPMGRLPAALAQPNAFPAARPPQREALAPPTPPDRCPPPSQEPTPDLRGITGGTGFLEYSPFAAQLAAAESPMIVRGVVRRIFPGKWLPRDTTRLPTPQPGYGGAIMTPVLLEAREYVHGPQPYRALVVYLPGGSVGRVVAETNPSVLPTLAVGSEVIAFCQGPAVEITMPTCRDGYPAWTALLVYALTTGDMASLDGTGEGRIPLRALLDQIERGKQRR